MKNRPGRVYYAIDFKGLTPDFIEEYCNANLKDPTLTKQILTVSAMFDALNFDMLQALVEESNRYPQPVLELLKVLNVKPTFAGRGRFEYKLLIGGTVVPRENLDEATLSLVPLHPSGFDISYRKGTLSTASDDDDDWARACFIPTDLMEMDPVKGTYVFKNSSGDIVSLQAAPIQETNLERLLML